MTLIKELLVKWWSWLNKQEKQFSSSLNFRIDLKKLWFPSTLLHTFSEYILQVSAVQVSAMAHVLENLMTLTQRP